MATSSPTPPLTPSRPSSPETVVQPDHFYGCENSQKLPSPASDGRTFFDPTDDPLAHRGIPVFKPTMEEFRDFEAYMSQIECWGERSGIVKVIPPKEWRDSLPPLKEPLKHVKIKTPIEQHMLGSGGLFRQENMEKRRIMSIREWAELCAKEEFRAPGVNDMGRQARSTNPRRPTRKSKKRKTDGASVGVTAAEIRIKQECEDLLPPEPVLPPTTISSSNRASGFSTEPTPAMTDLLDPLEEEKKPTIKGGRKPRTREMREASLAQRAARDLAFLQTFDPHVDWLPPSTTASEYTPELCSELERQYWRNCGLGRPAWYGADTQGSLFTDETAVWNVAHLHSTLSRLLPSSSQGLPGVNTPYLYFGMWRATFAWHVEDMDLFSINYIHFGAPKFWYAVPQVRANALEQIMRGYFPKDTSQCPEFLRHKSFLASPKLLAQSSCKPNTLVQHAGEFVITFPRGYHAGFNLGFNCAESVNFALESWIELGRRAKACQCISDSVRINVDQLLQDRATEAANLAHPPSLPGPPKSRRTSSKKENDTKDIKTKIPAKRKAEPVEAISKPKKLKVKNSSSKPSSSALQTVSPSKASAPKLSVTLKLPPKPSETEFYPCCLCASTNKEGLLRVCDPPLGRKDAVDAAGNPKEWLAHEFCASIVPETWVDEVDIGGGAKEKVVFGVDGIVKDRWHLKCSACSKNQPKCHGAPIQCTKGKCPKAFHVSCARDGEDTGILLTVLREVEKEVVLLDATNTVSAESIQVDVDSNAAQTMVASDPQILKIIKKLEVQVLCAQHNPAVAAAKRASKQDKIKADLLALPSMARIKIRVSAGVFEVSLIRVIEETSSVEVLWDRGVKREFKWGSVVFGSTEGPVQQKPSELGPESELPRLGLPVPTFTSVTAAASAGQFQQGTTQPSRMAPTTTTQQYGNPYAYPRTIGYDYWTYPASQYRPPNQTSLPYGYPPYYPIPNVAGSYNSFYGQQYNTQQLYWQPTYQGQAQPDRQGATQAHGAETQAVAATGPVQDQSPPIVDRGVPGSAPSCDVKSAQRANDAAAVSAPTSTLTPTGDDESHSSVLNSIAAISSLQPSQISDLLRDNPQLRDAIIAAASEAKLALPTAS